MAVYSLARPFRVAIKKATITIAFAHLVGSGYAHDSGTPFAEWMMSLMQPAKPTVSCCGIAEQYWVKDYRPSNKNGIAFEATVVSKDSRTEFKVDVPRSVVIWDRANPTGRGIVFIRSDDFDQAVICFVPGLGT